MNKLHALVMAGDALPWPSDAARSWIVVTAAVIAVLVAVGLPVLERVRGAIGACAEPRITIHNDDDDAHAVALKDVRAAIAELRTATALLDGCVRSQQGQIEKIDATRKETLQLVMQQVQQAVDLLSRERE